MTDWLLLQMSAWGAPLLFLVTFMSCLAAPIPASLMMMAGGAFVASGDLSMAQVMGLSFAGAVSGDQTGFLIGRHGTEKMRGFINRNPKRASLFRQANDLTAKHGGVAVFLSRWALSPLGPYANFAAGAVGMNRPVFSVWGAAGEAVWVVLYVGLGMLFADRISSVASIASDLSGLLAGIGVVLVSGFWLRQKWRSGG